MTLRMFRLCILAAAWIILGSATPARHKSPEARQTMYYWYWDDTDFFFEYASTATAITDFEFATGKLVNTQPGGGTRLANGFLFSTYPHTLPPNVILFTH
ncbi:MAG TPA: hypothetical protein VHC48_12470 [Puia sp.]|nr:hypothetical protein [Puia sp.]